MKYMGSKNRIAKYLLPIILKDRKPNQWYVEPFVGGANMIDKVDGNRIGFDINPYLIDCLRWISEGNEPPKELTENEYNNIKVNKDNYPKYLVGYAGFQLSYGGKFFGGYRRDKEGKRNYSLEAYNNTVKQQKNIRDVVFECRDYKNFIPKEECIIYCDPPYEGTTKYKNDFNHLEFWEWCRQRAKEGHKVFISEYKAPNDFKCVWKKEITSSLTKNTGSKKGVENLFVYCG